jgi:PAS domain S-box-containing protein
MRSGDDGHRVNEHRLRLLIDSIHDYAIFMLDPDGRVASWNPGAQRIKQYRAEEILGQHFSRFYPEEDVKAGKCERELVAAARDGRFEDERWRVRKDGTRFWANVIFSAVHDEQGTLIGFAKVTRDLTDRMRAEEDRMRLAKAEEAVRMRDDFLSIASHELKTPLTSMQLQVSGILRSLAKPGNARPDRLVERLTVVDAQIGRMSTLVNNLLDVSRAASGELQIDPEACDLADVVRDAAARLRDEATSAGSTLSLSLDPSIPGQWDRLRIDQIATNLLTNAIKYGAGKPIDVVAKQEATGVTLSVRDRGIGIAADERERIFERFARAVSREHYGGLGLGLWIVRQIVDAMGGTIRVESEPDEGTTFVVHLPRRSSDADL